jgi:arsenite oxidase large subunit
LRQVATDRFTRLTSMNGERRLRRTEKYRDASCSARPDSLIAAGIAQNIERLLQEDGQNDHADPFKGQVRWQMEVLHGGWWGWVCRAV